MRYSEIIDFPRSYDRQKFPVIALLDVEARIAQNVENVIASMTQAKVVGIDLGDDDRIHIHVACTSEAVKDRLESRWT